MEHHRVEFIVILNQVFLRIFCLEEHRIREPRGNNFAIPCFNRLTAIRRDLVGDNNEMRREISCFGVTDGKCLLMRFQCQANDFIGQFQKALIHIAEQHDRPFSEARHFIKEAFILNKL